MILQGLCGDSLHSPSAILIHVLSTSDKEHNSFAELPPDIVALLN